MRASIDAVSESARAITTAVVIEGRDEVTGIIGIPGYRRLVLSLPATLQIRIANVETILIDLDIQTEDLAASVILHGKVRGRGPTGC